MANSSIEAHNIAVYVDLENVAIGVRDARFKALDIGIVLKRLVDKGNIVVRRAYADWSRYADYKRPLHEAGVELTDMPGSKITGKNSADIKMVVDALELSYTKPHIDVFALVSGDSDFSPLVLKLRENNKHPNEKGVGSRDCRKRHAKPSRSCSKPWRRCNARTSSCTARSSRRPEAEAHHA
jgi:uncharacterized protein (TIGR00288 family)